MADFLLSFLFSGGLISVIIIIAVIALFFNLCRWDYGFRPLPPELTWEFLI